MSELPQEGLIKKNKDPLVTMLNKYVVLSVRILAILMVGVIWVSLIDVIIHLAHQLFSPSYSFFSTDNLISTLGDFLAVMIAIEIFLNIIFYLNEDAINVPLVLATALTAVARKVIIVDYKAVDPHHVYATASVIFAVGIVYWLITKKS